MAPWNGWKTQYGESFGPGVCPLSDCRRQFSKLSPNQIYCCTRHRIIGNNRQARERWKMRRKEKGKR